MPERSTQLTAVCAALSFPCGSPPAPGEALEVAPGVLWLRMRLPMAGLNHINLWALEAAAGWTLIDTGEELAIGGRLWRAVVGRGHSPEHLCLHCPQLEVLISGDQVLPRISSNVSVFPTEPDANPLSEWLESLAAIKRQVPDEVLVLPSHNEPFRGLHARLEALIEGHEERLARVHQELSQPQRAIDVFGALFRRRVGLDMLGMATGESIAHLTCLIARGVATGELDAAGVTWYRRV